MQQEAYLAQVAAESSTLIPFYSLYFIYLLLSLLLLCLFINLPVNQWPGVAKEPRHFGFFHYFTVFK